MDRIETPSCRIRVDAEGRIVEFDDAAATLFGVPASQAMGKPLAEIACAALARESAGRAAAIKELEAFSYAVAHDLRAPLRHVQGFAQMLEQDAKGKLDTECLHFLEVIVSSAKKMNSMLEGLLAFSRAGRAEVKRSELDMAQLAAEAVAEVKRAAGNRSIEWVVGDLPPATGDKTLIAQVWKALLENAVKFTRNTPAARIEVGARDGEYFVRDNGAGFDARYVGKLMKIFQRVHAESEFEGLGVGLAVAHRIVTRHGGELRIDGRANEGATAAFTLPA